MFIQAQCLAVIDFASGLAFRAFNSALCFAVSAGGLEGSISYLTIRFFMMPPLLSDSTLENLFMPKK